MSTLSKFQRLRARSKTTKRNSVSTIICLEITSRKIQNTHPNPRRENSPSKTHSLRRLTRNSPKNPTETVRPTKKSPPRNHAKSPNFMYHKETSKRICNANQLTGFHKRRAPPITRYFQTD